MQLDQHSLSQSIPRPSIQGDPATRAFGLFLIGALAVITIGTIIGIITGNIAHYGYFSPYNTTNISVNYLLNETIQKNLITTNSRLWLPVNERFKRSISSRKIRHTWLLIEKPANNRRW